MYRPFRTRSARRGNTLIVVLSLLSLLAVLGITAVYISGDEATRSKTQGQENTSDQYPDAGAGMAAFNSFLSSQIYDDGDAGQGMLNALRGHSLMATMYGRVTGATTAWGGVGTFDEATPLGIPRRMLVNHRAFAGMGVFLDPEWTGSRATNAAPGSGAGQQYIPKNPAYTYPDVKDFYLASVCPATGEVLVPSYFRSNLFGSLAPGNVNWTNAEGKFLTLRPRRAEHPNFPLVPANADNTYTGDVRNLPGGYFYNGTRHVARNDSIWIDIGLPPFTLPNGRRVKPLVAPLILDLDGLLNLNVIGNMMAGGNHASHHGLGRWEVSLQRVLAAEGQAIVGARGSPQLRSGLTTRPFDPRLPTGQQLPSYSAISWSGSGVGAGSFTLPGVGSLFSNYPVYGAGYDSMNATIPSHAGLFIPREWAATTLGATNPMRTFDISDTKLLQHRFAGTPGVYTLMDVATATPPVPPQTQPLTQLKGSFPVAIPNPQQQFTANGYRLDPAHANRGIFTNYSGILDRIGLTPGPGQSQATFGTVRANALGGVDLNRRLADYRLDSTQALSPTNLAAASVLITPTATTPARQAEVDRQLFCRDIFARLIVARNATNATVDANGNVVISEPVGTPNYNVLRNLAQIAANICDYRDEDEINTGFVWNPAAINDPFAATNFGPTELGNRVVFGVEKSRLVINEAYSEHVNDPTENGMPTQPSHVRFWLELLNPGNAGAGPLDDGGAQVYQPLNGTSPYRIEIARALDNAGAPKAGVIPFLDPAVHPENVTGGFDPTVTPEIRFTFNPTVAPVGKQRVLPNQGIYDPAGNPLQGVMLVAPTVPPMAKSSEFNPTAIVPPATMPAAPWNNVVVTPDPTGTTGNNGMAYRTGGVPQAADANRADYKRHVVLLRRLANPHLPESPTNPYVTVDYMDHVPAFDALLRLMGQNNDRMAGMGGYTDFPNRYAIGKIQPHAGLSVGVPAGMTNDPTFTFPNSMVLAQSPAAPLPTQPKHTFGRHNGTSATAPVAASTPPTDTILTPYEWLVHLDRPLINQMELLHVTTSRPHQLTQQFVIPAASGVSKHAAALFNGTPSTSTLFTTQMYRALDLLRIGGHGEGEAFHGRKAGMININTIQDKRIWDSLFDAQAGNGFTQAQVDAMWTALIQSRTVNMQQRHAANAQTLKDVTGSVPTADVFTPIPGATIYDNNTTTGDRPFLPFGVSQHTAPNPSMIGTASAFAGGQGIDDTILRRNAATGVPHLFNAAALHPYQQVEAARKILNNTTTVSNTFAVWVTVGFFDVENETVVPAGWPAGVPYQGQLGNEYFRQVPGDARQKFFAIVDRSMVGLDVANYAANTYTHATARPFFTTVEAANQSLATTAAGSPTLVIATDATGQVYTDAGEQPSTGRTPVPIIPSGQPSAMLAVGVGANQEFVTVTGVTPTVVNGRTVSTLTLAAPLTKNHFAGESVSNVMPGNPGPPPWLPVAPATQPLQFDVNDAIFRSVVPLWSRVP